MTTLFKKKNIITDEDDIIEDQANTIKELKQEEETKQNDQIKHDTHQSNQKEKKVAKPKDNLIEQKLKQITNNIQSQSKLDAQSQLKKPRVFNDKSTPKKSIKSPNKSNKKVLSQKRKRDESSSSSSSSDSDEESGNDSDSGLSSSSSSSSLSSIKRKEIIKKKVIHHSSPSNHNKKEEHKKHKKKEIVIEHSAKKKKEIPLKTKSSLINQLLTRWWYALPNWPPANFDPKDKLNEEKLRLVALSDWKKEVNIDENNFVKCTELPGFKFVFIDYLGKTHDLRPQENKPSYTSFKALPEEKLYSLAIKAYTAQIEDLKKNNNCERENNLLEELDEELKNLEKNAKKIKE